VSNAAAAATGNTSGWDTQQARADVTEAHHQSSAGALELEARARPRALPGN